MYLQWSRLRGRQKREGCSKLPKLSGYLPRSVRRADESGTLPLCNKKKYRHRQFFSSLKSQFSTSLPPPHWSESPQSDTCNEDGNKKCAGGDNFAGGGYCGCGPPAWLSQRILLGKSLFVVRAPVWTKTYFHLKASSRSAKGSKVCGFEVDAVLVFLLNSALCKNLTQM